MNALKVIIPAVGVALGVSLLIRTESEPAVEIQWLGGPTALIQFNDVAILTDPVLGEGKEAFVMVDPNQQFDPAQGPDVIAHERFGTLPAFAMSAVDLVLVSHGHEDHFDQKAESDMPKNIPLVVPTFDMDKMSDMGFNNVSPLSWGQQYTLQAGKGQIVITAINAHHSTISQVDTILGAGNGYWIEFSEGDWNKSLYWTGDTFPTDDVITVVKAKGKPDIFMPNMGKVGSEGTFGQISMGVSDVIKFASEISPEHIFPIHHTTHSHYREPIDQLKLDFDSDLYTLDAVSVGATVVYK